MREIKFRAWVPKEKVMCDWKELIADHYEFDEFNVEDGLVFLQYTGLKDKDSKGNDVYHKDILKVGDGYCGDHFEKGGNFIVEWGEDGWIVVNSKGEYLCGLWEAIYNRGVVIIGNIMENPELLK